MAETLRRQKGDSLGMRVWRTFLLSFLNIGYNSRLYRLRLKDRHPLKVGRSIDCPFPGDKEAGQRLLAGSFSYAGYESSPLKRSFWGDIKAGAPDAYKDWFHGFNWIHDLAAVENSEKETKALINQILKAWLKKHKKFDSHVWRPDLIGSRFIALLTHTNLALGSDDLVYRSALLTQMTREAKHLTRTAKRLENGQPRIRALAGLALRGLLLPNGEEAKRRAMKGLQRSIERLLLPDGGVFSRNPADAMHIAADLVLVRMALALTQQEIPDWLQINLDRIIPFLKGMSHADGDLAHMGSAYSCRSGETLATIYKNSGSKGAPMQNMAFTGYQRIEAGRTTAILDTGPPPPKSLSRMAHASCLSLELSDGKNRLVVNAGGSLAGASQNAYAQSEAARGTESHSTLWLDSTPNVRFGVRSLIIGGLKETTVERNENEDGTWLNLTHDGYAGRFGLIHQRRLFCSKDGSDIRGEDGLLPASKRPWFHRNAHKAQLFFHLHPNVSVSTIRDGTAVILRLPSGHGWLFRARGTRLSLADSLYWPCPEIAQRSRMIVLGNEDWKGNFKVNWSFRRMDSRE